VLKVNVDTAPQLAADLGVLSVPTLILFKNGRKIAGRSGALSAGQLRTFVEPALAHAPTQI
jgi:thioredoxin-like negative regulator of GroEL